MKKNSSESKVTKNINDSSMENEVVISGTAVLTIVEPARAAEIFYWAM